MFLFVLFKDSPEYKKRLRIRSTLFSHSKSLIQENEIQVSYISVLHEQ